MTISDIWPIAMTLIGALIVWQVNDFKSALKGLHADVKEILPQLAGHEAQLDGHSTRLKNLERVG